MNGPADGRFSSTLIDSHIGVKLSLLERYVRDVEEGGSNPLTPTSLTRWTTHPRRRPAL